MKKSSFLLVIGVIAVLLVGAYAGYLFWQKSALNERKLEVEKSVEEYNAKVLQYKNLEVLEAVNAKKAYNILKGDILKWSEVITKVRETVPGSLSNPLVDILSYSGSSGNSISMNVKTDAGSDEPYHDVADLIEAFDGSEYFADSFVPSISSGNDEEGREVLSFLFSTAYKAQSSGGGEPVVR
ncbi:MAG: hypothetical protein V1679_02925 [Candidatus Peregrinibacteria bacterium]